METRWAVFIKLILAVLLLLCLLDLPYGYYQFVRFAAIAGFIYLGYDFYQQQRTAEAYIFMALAVLFQPFIKIALGRTIWNIVDIVVGIGLLLSVLRNRNDDNRNPAQKL